MIPPGRLGWMAGVVDLKGRLVYKNNKMRATPQAVLTVNSKEFLIIRTLSTMTGTNPEMMKAIPMKDFMRRGCNDHCPEPHVHVSEIGPTDMPPIGRWTITGAGMVVVLLELIPFLQVDRGWQAAVEDTMEATVLEGRGATAVMTQLFRLRSLGWDIPDVFGAALDEYVLSRVEADAIAAASALKNDQGDIE